MRQPVKTAALKFHKSQPRKYKLFILAFTLFTLFSPIYLWAAPFSDYFQFVQPDGEQLTLWGEGDEFHAVFETTKGYTVVFNPQKQAYFYAKRSTDGKSLISTGVKAHKSIPPGLARHIRMDKDAVIAAARARQKKWDAETGLSRRWAQLKSQTLGTPLAPDGADVLPAPPGTTTIGTKVGLTLLIDFPDAPATINQTDIEAYLNGDSYTGYGNNGSVKQYFSDVSGARLSYTNVVTIYVRMAQPKSYYNDTSIPENAGVQGRSLINDALDILKARSDYNSMILPTFNSLSTDGSEIVLALNVLFAGLHSGVWSSGLWPHSWVLARPVELGNGKSVYRYQITNIGTSLQLGTFAHENGHLLCGFPDLYDYDYDSTGGAGVFSLMGSGGYGANPVQVDAYLKLAAGWATVTDLDSSSNLSGTLVAAPGCGYDHFYRYRRPGIATEYFLLENRQQTGRDSNLPGSGIAVWHVDELGNRDNQSMAPNSTHQNYELTLVQADNQWHFQSYFNDGDEFDLYYQGNIAAAYSNRLDDSSSPDTHWWDGSSSMMDLNSFSTSSMAMTFNIRTGECSRVYYLDNDEDGFGSPDYSTNACEPPVCYVINNDDCDDSSPAVHPGEDEVVADGIDQDCDGGDLCFVDADNDGYRPDDTSTVASTNLECTDSGEAAAADPIGDCDDSSPAVHPGAVDTPGDDIDDNCSGEVACYADADSDLYGAGAGEESSFTATNGLADTPGACASNDVDLYDDTNTDCDDSSPAVHPGANETAADGIDQDCDGDELCFVDADNDGYRPDGTSTVASADLTCTGSGEAAAADPIGDCDDSSPAVHPDANETVADGIDQDCDGGELCFVDADNDSYHTGSTVISSDPDCTDSGEAQSSDPIGDCDDSSPAVHPGANETAADGIDQDCDGDELCFVDADNDGYRPDSTSTVASPNLTCTGSGEAVAADPIGDCDDSSPAVHPGANEICSDNIDNDCLNGDLICQESSDNDNDGLSYGQEVNIYLSNPHNSDTDGDGLADGIEFLYWETDWNADPDGDLLINLLDPDSDNDGLKDGMEVIILGTDPALIDTDGNGIQDANEDTDGDGLINAKEIYCGSDPSDPGSQCIKSLPWLLLLLDQE